MPTFSPLPSLPLPHPSSGAVAPASGWLTPGQLARWRTELAWNDGEGLDGESCGRLLDEVERLREALKAARALARGAGAAVASGR
jgi:hypothetical protein